MLLGRNDNPSVKQFIACYKRLLVRCVIREGGIGNCIPQEQIDILNISLKSQIHDNDPEEEINSSIERARMLSENNVLILDQEVLNQQFLNEHNYVSHPCKLTDYTKHIVNYIAGFVVFKINKSLQSSDCLSALQGNFCPESLVAYKTKGFLQIPSQSVSGICQKTESVLRLKIYQLGENDTVLHRRHFLYIKLEVTNHFVNKNLFPEYDDHMHRSGHYSALIKLIIDKYLSTRYFFIAKRNSEKCSIRQRLNKTVHFKGM